jgi:DNA polymerase III subunit beta
VKFTIAKKDLVPDASTAASAAAKKPSMPSIGNVMIRATDGGVVMKGTDLFVGARVSRACDVAEEGAVLVLAKQFADACRALPDGDVTVRIDGNRLELKGGKTKHRIPWSDVAEYPALPECPDDAFSPVQASTVGACIAGAAHAMFVGEDSTRASYAGVHVKIEDCACTAQASNGHVAARRESQCATGATFEALIPYKAIGDLRKLIDGAKDGDIEIASRDGYVFARHGLTTISMRLTGELFPVVGASRVFSLPFNDHATFHRETTIEALKRVLFAATGDFAHVDFDFEPGTMKMRVGDDSEEEVSVDYAGAKFSIRLPGGGVVNALSAMTHDEIAMRLRTPLDPVAFVPADGGGNIQIVVPARAA